MRWLEAAPIPLIGVVVLGALLLTYEIALWLSRRRPGPAHSDARGYLVSSAMALLGLLVAFTFSAAQDRYRVRQELVVAEANAIGTSYLRVQLLDPPWRDTLSRELLRYGEYRVAFARALSPAQIERNAQETGVVQAAIWRDLTLAIRANPRPTLDMPLLLTFNETFDLAAARRAAREARVPLLILRGLVLCSLTIAAIVGYATGGERGHMGLLVGVMLLLTLALCLILDLDRPVSGGVQVNEAPLQRAVQDIRAGLRAPPATNLAS